MVDKSADPNDDQPKRRTTTIGLILEARRITGLDEPIGIHRNQELDRGSIPPWAPWNLVDDHGVMDLERTALPEFHPRPKRRVLWGWSEFHHSQRPIVIVATMDEWNPFMLVGGRIGIGSSSTHDDDDCTL